MKTSRSDSGINSEFPTLTGKQRAELKRTMRAEQDAQTVNRRCYSIFRHMQEKAKDLARLHEINFDVEALRNLAGAAIGTPCVWCAKKLTPRNFCFDHETPTSRGGSLSLDNLKVPCASCNQKKGSLTRDEFSELLQAIEHFPDQARADILTRLGVGGRWKMN